MMCRVGPYGVALLFVLGGLSLSAPATARAGYQPCSLVSVSETEALAGTKVVKSVESATLRDSVCRRWLAGDRMFLLTVGVSTTGEANVALAADGLSSQAYERIRNMGGTRVSKQFGEITCTTVGVPSNPGLGTTTCSAVKIPLYYGDGFDWTASVVKQPLRFTLQIAAGPKGLVSMDAAHALAEKVLARMP